MCEIFLKNKCFGCVGLDPQYDIDKIKKECETYKEEMEKNGNKFRKIRKNMWK